MRRFLPLSTALVLTLGLLPAAPTSYVVLQKGTTNSLIRISSDGKSMTTIAEGFEGVSLAIDGGGNYIIGARDRLLRVTPSGAVSTIATAPEGALWTAVAVDASGNLIVADGRKPAVWRVSPDGLSIVQVATYDGLVYTVDRPVGIVVDNDGDYRLVVLGVDPADRHTAARVYRVSPGGTVRAIRLHGARSRRFSGGLALDDRGNLLIADLLESAIFRIAGDGEVTRLDAEPSPCRGDVLGLARDPATGDLLITGELCQAVIRTNPDGSGVATLARFGKLAFPIAVAVQPGR
jgi:DNA-binding beta-propeller fold protein YncE